MTNQKDIGENDYIPIAHWPNYKIKMLFLNIKEKQSNINYILTMGDLPFFKSSIIRKKFKSRELLNKHLNDNIQMCCQLIPKFFLDNTQCIKTPFIFQRTKNLHNYDFNQFYVLWNPLHNNLGCGQLLPQMCERV